MQIKKYETTRIKDNIKKQFFKEDDKIRIKEDEKIRIKDNEKIKIRN